MAGIVDFMKQMTVFLIMARMILRLRPKQEYEKYLKLVVGIMILAMVIEKGAVLWETILSESF